jgi:hypothetical protein
MRRGAPCTVVSPCRCLVTVVVRPCWQCPSVCLLSCPGCGSTRWPLAGGACGRRPSGRASLRRPGMPGRRPCRPSPPASTVRCPPIRFPRPGPVSNRPVSNRPVSGQLVPSSGSNRPAGWCPPVRPVTSSSVSARRWPWGSRRGGGQPCDRDGSGCRWSAGPSGLVDGPSRPGGGDAVEMVVGRWGSGGRGPGRVGLGRRLRRARPLAGGGGQLGVRVAGRCRLS